MLSGLQGWVGPYPLGFSWNPDPPPFTHVPQTPEALVPEEDPSQAQGCQELVQRVHSVGDTCDEWLQGHLMRAREQFGVFLRTGPPRCCA